MTQRFTQPMLTRRATDLVVGRGAPTQDQGVDEAYILAGAVKAFNQRQKGRSYERDTQESLFDAVRAFQARQAAQRPAPQSPYHAGPRTGLPAGWSAPAPIRPLQEDTWQPNRPPLRPLSKPGAYED